MIERPMMTKNATKAATTAITHESTSKLRGQGQGTEMDASSGNVTQNIPCVLVVRAAELGVELDGSLEVSRSVVSDQAIAIEELKYLAVQTIIGMVKTTEGEVRLQHVPVCCQQVHGLYVACTSPV